MTLDEFEPWPFYCEESIARLSGCEELMGLTAEVWTLCHGSGGFVMARQQKGEGELGLISWDYHVVLLVSDGSEHRIYDPDSQLGCPVPARRWLRESFPTLLGLFAAPRPLVRVLEAGRYREILRSDRSHMMDDEGRWIAPPPPWPAPGSGSAGEASNVLALADPNSTQPGALIKLDELKERFEKVG